MRVLLSFLAFSLLTAGFVSAEDGVVETNDSNIRSQSSSSFHSSNTGEDGKEKVSSSQSAATVNQKCHNGECQTCINDKCFKGAGDYTSVQAVGGCPPAACIKGCESVVMAKDGCPICSCGDGTGVREPCGSRSDCPANATDCKKNACAYPGVSADSPKSCQFTRDCPSGFQCRKQSCMKGGPEHTSDTCVFDHQCPTKYSCDDMTCIYSGVEHGRSPCVSSSQCDKGQSCIKMTCQ